MIQEFKNEYSWLSNFSPVEIELGGVIYSSVEHAYMSAKSPNTEWKIFCRDTENPGKVKKEGRKVNLICGWDSIKVSIMRSCLLQKFQQEPYKSLLIKTGDEHIQEGNWWNDQFWGVDLKTGRGENVLGNIIMDIRKELLEKNNG